MSYGPQGAPGPGYVPSENYGAGTDSGVPSPSYGSDEDYGMEAGNGYIQDSHYGGREYMPYGSGDAYGTEETYDSGIDYGAPEDYPDSHDYDQVPWQEPEGGDRPGRGRPVMGIENMGMPIPMEVIPRPDLMLWMKR